MINGVSVHKGEGGPIFLAAAQMFNDADNPTQAVYGDYTLIKDKEKFQEIRVKSIETLQDSFLEDTQDPDVVMEISEILNDVFNKVDREKGTNGLLDFIESQLVELKKVRYKEKNRGREHHSPLPWWKIIAIALWLCVAIYFVILCLIKSPESIVAFVACMVYYVGISSTAINVIKGIVAWC